MRDYRKLHYVECIHCHYKWRSVSEMAWVTCSNCLQKTPNKPESKMPRTLQAQKIEAALKGEQFKET